MQWRHQVMAWTKVDLPPKMFCGHVSNFMGKARELNPYHVFGDYISNYYRQHLPMADELIIFKFLVITHIHAHIVVVK